MNIYDKLVQFSKKTFEYFRIKDRSEIKICSKEIPITKEFLEKVFKKKIPKEKKRYYKRKFIKNCNELVNFLYDAEYIEEIHSNIYNYIEKEVEINNKKSLEILINIILFTGSLTISWSEYLMMYPSGQKILKNVFFSPTDVNALSNLYDIIENVYIKRGYDDYFFKKEFFKILPNLDEVTKNTFFRNKYALWISNKISTKFFLNILDKSKL